MKEQVKAKENSMFSLVTVGCDLKGYVCIGV